MKNETEDMPHVPHLVHEISNESGKRSFVAIVIQRVSSAHDSLYALNCFHPVFTPLPVRAFPVIIIPSGISAQVSAIFLSIYTGSNAAANEMLAM